MNVTYDEARRGRTMRPSRATPSKNGHVEVSNVIELIAQAHHDLLVAASQLESGDVHCTMLRGLRCVQAVHDALVAQSRPRPHNGNPRR